MHSDTTELIDSAAYCLSRRAFLIVAADPADSTPDKLAALMQGAGAPKRDNAAVYGPWIKIGDPLNGGKLLKMALAAYEPADPTRTGGGAPMSLLYFPINVQASVILCAIIGNLSFGASNLGLIRRNFAAPLDNWLFANAQL